MTSSPNQLPSGKQFELRVAASNLTLDTLLSELTLPATRSSLPGYLQLYSDKLFHLNVEDRDIDGHSLTDTQFRGFQMRVTNNIRNKFPLDSTVEKVRLTTGDKDLRIKVGLQLGVQVASELMISPFFDKEERDAGLIGFYYTIPDPVHTRTMGVAFNNLQEYLAKGPRGVVDELMLVESALRTRAIRQRKRPDNPITALVDITASADELFNQDDTLRDVS
jgi:hypothetical protein